MMVFWQIAYQSGKRAYDVFWQYIFLHISGLLMCKNKTTIIHNVPIIWDGYIDLFLSLSFI